MLGRMNKCFYTDKNNCVIGISCHVIQHDLYLRKLLKQNLLYSIYIAFSISVLFEQFNTDDFKQSFFVLIVFVLYLTGKFGEHGEIGKTRGS